MNYAMAMLNNTPSSKVHHARAEVYTPRGLRLTLKPRDVNLKILRKMWCRTLVNHGRNGVVHVPWSRIMPASSFNQRQHQATENAAMPSVCGGSDFDPPQWSLLHRKGLQYRL